MKPIHKSPFAHWLWYHLIPRVPITRHLYGLDLEGNARDHSNWLFKTSRQIERIEDAPRLLKPFEGHLWDVGCNLGLYSCVWMKYGGLMATAFDLSPESCGYATYNAAFNGFQQKITTVAKPLTVVHGIPYDPPRTASPGNQMMVKIAGDFRSIGYREAADRYGIPDAIKMDIEGGEFYFLEDDVFLHWVHANRIRLIIEVHGPIAGRYPNLSFYPVHNRTYFVHV